MKMRQLLASAADFAWKASPQTGPMTAPLDSDESLIEFYRRVLDEAQDESNPVLERVKFLGILGTLLDEFVATRSLGSTEAGTWIFGARRLGFRQAESERLQAKLCALFSAASVHLNDGVAPALADRGIHLLPYKGLQPKERADVDACFAQSVLPLLMPLGFDAARPFPHISSRCTTLAVLLREGTTERLALIQIPPNAPRFLQFHRRPVDTNGRHELTVEQGFVWVDDAISANLAAIFPGTEILGAHGFRLIRDERTDSIPPATPIRDAIVTRLQRREFGKVLAVTADARMPQSLLTLLVRHLGVARSAVTTCADLKDLGYLNELARLNRPELRHKAIASRRPPELVFNRRIPDIFAAIRGGDVLLHHPYESFEPVADFFETASCDPDVIAISSTLYRTDQDSRFVDSLVAASHAGKQVRAVVELRARCDEKNNLTLGRRLENAGAHVVYGTVDRKVHAKLTLVVRREAGRLRRYVHLSSGNYSSATAGCYTDVGVFSCHDAIGADTTELFNVLTGYGAPRDFRTMLVSPITLRRRVMELIDREAAWAGKGQPASMILKMNALADAEIIARLYRASQAGVRIDLIVRGICCLRPGVAGLSENIRVRSIVGRFLEHSRAWYFGNGGEEEIYIGSADLTSRNLDGRIEVMLRLDDARLKRRVRDEILAAYLADNVKARELTPTGSYVRVPGLPNVAAINSQELLQ
jgi:polyphosphate kinase